MVETSPLRTRLGLVHGNAVLFASGEVDPSTAPILEAAIRRVMVWGDDVVLDLSAITFIDSSGLLLLLAAHALLEERGDQLILRSPSDRVMHLLVVAGLSNHFVVHPAAEPDSR